jgi:hypothetical protein
MNVLLATVALSLLLCTGCGKDHSDTSKMLVVTNGVKVADWSVGSCAPIYLTQEQQDARQHKWGAKNLPEVDKAIQHGAEAKVTLRVVDSQGMPVPEANIQIAFFPKDSYDAAKITKGLTDKDGFFVASGKTVDDISFTAMKTNYYVTSRKFHFYWRGTECAKDGHWIPWNPTLEVVLKEKRKPIPLIFTWETKVVIPKNEQVGYDCLEKSLVAPYGTGKNTDFMLIYSSNNKPRLNLENELTIMFPDDCGFIKLPKDTFSQFPSLHEAPQDGYSKEWTFRFARTPTAILKDEGLQDTEYFIMRSRVRKDEQGNRSSAMYGKFYRFAFDESDDGKTGYLLLQYAINPTLNDRNLEMEGHYP